MHDGFDASESARATGFENNTKTRDWSVMMNNTYCSLLYTPIQIQIQTLSIRDYLSASYVNGLGVLSMYCTRVED